MMNRAPCDNALLQACDRVHAKLPLYVALLGAAVGTFWYALVCLKAGLIG